MWKLKCGRCRALCYFYSIEPLVGDVVYANYCMDTDGRQPLNGDLTKCPNCGPIRIETFTWCKIPEADSMDLDELINHYAGQVRAHKSGVMMSMAEAIHGEIWCQTFLTQLLALRKLQRGTPLP